MTERVEVTELDEEGFGKGVLTKQDGSTKTLIIPYSLVGDVVDVEVWRGRKRKHAIGHIKEIVTKSQDRQEARCSHFGMCGGCSFQHMAYDKQLSIKEEKIKKLFSDPLFQTGRLYPIIGSPKSWNYRNKMEYSFSQNAKGDRYLGLMIANTRGYVFNLNECHLVDSWFAKTCQAARAWWEENGLLAYAHGKDSGSLRTLTLRQGASSGDRMVILTVSGNPEYALKQHDLDSFVRAMQEVAAPLAPAHLSLVLRIQQIAKGSPTQFYEMILSGPDYIREYVKAATQDGTEQTLEFQISPQAFFQPNTTTANILYRRALELAAIHSQSVVYDLYCGIGVFGMCASLLAKKVVAIELSPESAYDAKTNSARLGLDRFTIYKGDVGKVLEEKKEELLPPDVVILDPPRAGLDERAIEEVLRLKPACIVYVSCNPATQSQNVRAFIEKGYTLESLQPVDQFPHTPHVENIVVLRCEQK
jgi:23S rRNA (uracil1939-C5)-methyltransferase